MTPAQDIHKQAVPPRVSILARLVPVFSLCILMLGAALCAVLLMRVLEAMRNAESAGVGAVAGGMAEANLAITIALFCGAIVRFAGILILAVRAFTTTKTASPSTFFFSDQRHAGSFATSLLVGGSISFSEWHTRWKYFFGGGKPSAISQADYY